MNKQVLGGTIAMDYKPKGILEQMREYARIKGTAGIGMVGINPPNFSLNTMSEGEYIMALMKHVREQRAANEMRKETV